MRWVVRAVLLLVRVESRARYGCQCSQPASQGKWGRNADERRDQHMELQGNESATTRSKIGWKAALPAVRPAAHTGGSLPGRRKQLRFQHHFASLPSNRCDFEYLKSNNEPVPLNEMTVWPTIWL
eukprot:GHVU01150080.1.p1 GENE.GHVU01150080.1~~GHVU01150080.1.p1  ORF type:complete len:125 (+),score=7.00 GHVU01150080.1:3-377(+)